MTDSFSRQIQYMRISVTDHCNANCIYCAPNSMKHYPLEELLTHDEFLRICGIFASLGVQHFRITGGEPLMYKDCARLVRNLKNTAGVKTVSITTNAINMHTHIEKLILSGIDSINISLDTVTPNIYKKMSGVDKCNDVFTAINEAMRHKIKLKINTVVIKGINNSEVLPLAELAKNNPIDVRFIEFMPSKTNLEIKGIPNEVILQSIKAKYPDIHMCDKLHGMGPAVYYESKYLQGKIGFISPHSHNFCESCNRVRLSSTGFLRLCLHHPHGVDLRKLLRNNASDDDIKSEILHAVRYKPRQHLMKTKTILDEMHKIGG